MPEIVDPYLLNASALHSDIKGTPKVIQLLWEEPVIWHGFIYVLHILSDLFSQELWNIHNTLPFVGLWWLYGVPSGQMVECLINVYLVVPKVNIVQCERQQLPGSHAGIV